MLYIILIFRSSKFDFIDNCGRIIPESHFILYEFIIFNRFQKVTSFSMSSLSSIETIDIGNDCFSDVTSEIRLNHFPELISMKIGHRSFYNEDSPDVITKVFQMYNNSKLVSIEIGEYIHSNETSFITESYNWFDWKWI